MSESRYLAIIFPTPEYYSIPPLRPRPTHYHGDTHHLPMTSPAPSVPLPPRKWLVAYNSISASLWSIVLFNTVFLASTTGQPHLFIHTHHITTAIQSLALVEVFNAATGVVRSPVFTTLTQVASRLLVVYGINTFLPNSPANHHWSYISLCLSWSITEIIRYSFYASSLRDPATVPYWLTYLRYTTFYVLYPCGVFSETMMIYLSLDEASRVFGSWYSVLLKIILASYVPGLYMLYSYMIKQRKKVLGRGNKQTSHSRDKPTPRNKMD